MYVILYSVPTCVFYFFCKNKKQGFSTPSSLCRTVSMSVGGSCASSNGSGSSSNNSSSSGRSSGSSIGAGSILLRLGATATAVS